MGLFDTLKGSLGGIEAAALPGILNQVLPSGLQGVLNQLQQTGLGAQVSSWLGNGPNQPITVDQLRAALTDQHVEKIAQSLGVPTDKVLELLAAHLPAAVDQQSPNGVLQQPQATAGGENP